nr:hypothetical protein [Bacteroidota bacterium]
MIKNTIKGHPIRIFATLLIATALLTGCVEINEKIIINDDGSGNFSMSVGIESNNFIFGLFSAYSDLSFLDHSDNELKKVSKILQTQKGIQNVIYQFDRKSGRVGISFDFTNSKSLNKALYAIANHEKTIFMPAVYKVNKHSFSRKNTTKWLNMLMEQNEEKMP